ncbi:MAG: glutamine amidotransferase [Polyangiales bacterium]
MRPVLIIKTGKTLPSVAARRLDYETWIATGMGLAETQVTVCAVFDDEPLPDPGATSAVVVTGSSSMVTDREPWSERTAAWLRDAVSARTPVLAICYGHQLLAHAFGGKVEYNPLGRQIGTIDVALTEAAQHDALFSGFEPVLHLPVSHRQSVIALPESARRLATSARDPNHAFALGDQAWGVQFHPEFDADIVRGYIAARCEQIAAEGLDPDALSARATDTPHGTLLLRRFANLARQHDG